MKAWWAIGLVFVAACRFKGQSHVTVQIYGGELPPLQYLPDVRDVMASAAEVEMACRDGQREVADAAKRAGQTSKLCRDLLFQLDAAARKLLAGPYAELAPRYLKTWKQLRSELLAANVNDTAALTKALETARTEWKKLDLVVEGVDVGPWLLTELRRLTPLQAVEVQDLIIAVELALKAHEVEVAPLAEAMKKQVAKPGEQSRPAAAVLGDGLEGLTKMSTELPSAIFQTSATTAAFEGTISAVDDLTAATSENELAAVAAARQKLSEAAVAARAKDLEAAGVDARIAAELHAAVELQRAAEAYAQTLDERVQSLRPDKLEHAWRTTIDLLLRDWSELSSKLEPELARRVQVVREDAQEDASFFDSWHGQVRLASLALAKAVSAPGEVRSRADNLVEQTRRQPFVAADSNVAKITDDANQKLWRNVPVDNLTANGVGLTQFVIVQDGPTTYRLKELHVDPSGVIDLRLSMADVGLDALTAIAEAQLGLELTKDDEAEDGAVTESQRDVVSLEQLDVLEGEAERTLAGLTKFLRDQATTLKASTAARPTDEFLARLKSRLAGDATRLESITSRAKDFLDLDASDSAGASPSTPTSN